MFIVAGLGNPGVRYAGTRPTVGFEVIARLSSRHRIPVETRKFRGLTGTGMIGPEKVLLVKPQTYMNESGLCIREILNFYHADPGSLIVVVDDVNLDPGQLRVRAKGSAGGHNGLKSIIAECGSQEFARVRVGVGEKDPRMDLADYVLSRFRPEDTERMQDAFLMAADAVCAILEDGTEAAMSRFNRRL